MLLVLQMYRVCVAGLSSRLENYQLLLHEVSSYSVTYMIISYITENRALEKNRQARKQFQPVFFLPQKVLDFQTKCRTTISFEFCKEQFFLLALNYIKPDLIGVNINNRSNRNEFTPPGVKMPESRRGADRTQSWTDPPGVETRPPQRQFDPRQNVGCYKLYASRKRFWTDKAADSSYKCGIAGRCQGIQKRNNNNGGWGPNSACGHIQQSQARLLVSH